MDSLVGAVRSGDGTVRVVTCELVLSVRELAEIVLQIAASTTAGPTLLERFDVRDGGGLSQLGRDLGGPHGSRLQVVIAPPGRLEVSYRGEIASRAPAIGPLGALSPSAEAWWESPGYQQQMYLRPSRYCPSDHLVGFAVAEFGIGADIGDRVATITRWIGQRIGYVPGSSSVHDSAEDTLLRGVGTCRDFAHLGIALCRAIGIPARFAAVYAPGLSPMDFHAVFEAFHDERWYVYDATGLAPRQSLVRIATGRDAADAAFAAVTRGIVDLESLEVSATIAPALPLDDQQLLVELA